jgi:hypothetical protein
MQLAFCRRALPIESPLRTMAALRIHDGSKRLPVGEKPIAVEPSDYHFASRRSVIACERVYADADGRPVPIEVPGRRHGARWSRRRPFPSSTPGAHGLRGKLPSGKVVPKR